MEGLNAQSIREDLASKIPLVRQKAADHLKSLIVQKGRLLDPEDPRIKELVLLLNSPAIKRGVKGLEQVTFSEQDSNVRAGLTKTLGGVRTEERMAIQAALRSAGQMIDAARRQATGNTIK